MTSITKAEITPETLLGLVKQKFGVSYKLFSFVSDLVFVSRGIKELSPHLSAADQDEELEAIGSFMKELAGRVIPFSH